MKAIQLHGTAKKIHELFKLRKQALRDGAYRVANRLHAVAFNMEGKTAPEISNLLKVHRTKVCLWLNQWRKFGTEGLLEGHRSGRPAQLSDNQRRSLADILESGPLAFGFNSGVWTCPMVARIIEQEFSITYHPAHVSRLLHELHFSVQRPKKYWLKLTKAFNPAGFGIAIRLLKKSQKRKSRNSIRGRSQLSARPNPLSNLGSGRFTATDTHNRPTKHIENIRHHRTIFSQIPVSLSRRLQRQYLCRVSKTNSAKLFSSQDLSDPRQCIVSQRPERLELVFRATKVSPSSQSSAIFTGTQRHRKNMASYSCSRYPQSIFFNARRTSHHLNEDFWQHPKKPNTSTWVSATVSMSAL